jgi:hypothetical protein
VVRDSLCYHAEGKSIVVEAPTEIGSARRWRGNHRPNGIFIARGPHIRPGATVADACLYDIAPTILYLQDHPIPSDMDGDVLTDIFSQEQLRRRPVRYSEPADVGVEPSEMVLDAEEATRIEERLRSLGYID